jgi:hypothetical protein
MKKKNYSKKKKKTECEIHGQLFLFRKITFLLLEELLLNL